MAQLVPLLVVAVLYDAAFPDRNGRLLHNGIPYKLEDILKGIQLPAQLCQKFAVKFSQYPFDVGKHFQRASEGNQVPWIGCLIADSPYQTLQVIDGI